jgi:predicted RNA-binding protein with RPS1 domain
VPEDRCGTDPEVVTEFERSLNLLSKISGEYIARAASTLSDAQTAGDDVQDVIISVRRLGKVRISFRAFKHKRGKDDELVMDRGKRGE